MAAEIAGLTLGLLQMDLTGPVEDNLAKADGLLKEARERGATLAVLPELFPHPWFPVTEDASHFGCAESEDGPLMARFSALAVRHGLTLVVPTYERAGLARYNTTFILAPTGAILGRYRKNHIPYHPGWYEKFYYAPGDLGFPVFHQHGLTFGIQTCWDNLFPEGSRILGLQGVHLILAPRATGDYSRPRWRTALAANALANNCFVATVNRTGLEGGSYRFGGDSLVIDPNGTILAAAEKPDEVVIAAVDPAAVYQSRAEWPFREDRRPGLYRDLIFGAAGTGQRRT